MDLADNYKIATAKSLTELAIQYGLISKYESEEETAAAVCNFFKTTFKELDSEE